MESDPEPEVKLLAIETDCLTPSVSVIQPCGVGCICDVSQFVAKFGAFAACDKLDLSTFVAVLSDWLSSSSSVSLALP